MLGTKEKISLDTQSRTHTEKERKLQTCTGDRTFWQLKKDHVPKGFKV